MLAALGLLVLVPGVGAASCKFFLDCGTDVGGKTLPPLRLERAGLVHETVASGFSAPSAFAFLPDGRILVGQVNGIIQVIKNGKVLRRPFLDVSGHVNTERTRGFLSIEPDPEFAKTGHVYLMYAYEDGTESVRGEKPVRVSRVTARGDRAFLDSEVVILSRAGRGSCTSLPTTADCIPANGIHTGGALDFAADGTLFVGTGDGELGRVGEYEPGAHQAQNLDALSGKILRVTRSGKGLPSNPYWTGDPDDNRSKVWAYGARNPFRLTVRPGTLLPYVGDVGWDSIEEIDVARRGANLGWPCYEGRLRAMHYRDTPKCADLYARGGRAVAFPIIAWSHDVASSITGGEFRGRDEYVYGDYGKWWLRTVRINSDGGVVPGSDRRLTTGTRAPTQIRIGPDGDIYYLSIAGGLHRVRAVKR